MFYRQKRSLEDNLEGGGKKMISPKWVTKLINLSNDRTLGRPFEHSL